MRKTENQFPTNYRNFMKTMALGSAGGFIGLSSANDQGLTNSKNSVLPANPATGKIKITDLRCAIIGNSPVIRITTDAGIVGYGQAE